MKRTLTNLAVLLAVATSVPVYADDPAAPPTKEQLEQAKKAFEEGNALYKQGQLEAAVIKLKESFRLSRNAFLLYNIGQTYDQIGKKDLVLFYYEKFLASAPATAPMRPNVDKRVAELKAEGIVAATGEPDDQVAVVAQPTSKYSAKDFQHEQVFTVPPGNPVDIIARVPQDSGLTVKLFYRQAGEAAFQAKPMTWRNIELVARIPAGKVSGSNVQYYIEVRDDKGTLITRSGKSTSPHLVNIERSAKPQYYADFVDEGGEVFTPVSTVEEPLGIGVDGQPLPEGKPSKGLRAAKWITTGVSVGLFGTALYTYVMAGKQHDKLLADANACGLPPCIEFDAQFGQEVERQGVRYERIYQVTLGIGIATTALAGYLWYRDLKSKRRPAEGTVTVIPVLDDNYAGATATARF